MIPTVPLSKGPKMMQNTSLRVSCFQVVDFMCKTLQLGDYHVKNLNYHLLF